MTGGLFFEDLTVGATFTTARATITEEAIIAFAMMWDPQPFHIDRISAGESIFGGLVGSGLHTFMTSYRLYFDHGLLKGTALAGLGIENLSFLGPLRPGDTIQVTVTILDKRASRKPDRGVVRLRLETHAQASEPILRFDLVVLVACRIEHGL